MTDHPREDDLTELAIGAVAGVERALALQHVVGCGRCGRELAHLSRAADELLTLAPHREPPAGFESAVIARFTGPADEQADAGPRPPRRLLLSLAAAVVAAAFGAAAVWQVTAGDRHAAYEQRTALAVAGGGHFTAIPIATESGARAGTVFLYDGDPSWLMVSLTGAPVDGEYSMVVYDRDGASYAADVCDVEDGVGMDGSRLYRPVDEIASVQLVGPGGVRLSAHS